MNGAKAPQAAPQADPTAPPQAALPEGQRYKTYQELLDELQNGADQIEALRAQIGAQASQHSSEKAMMHAGAKRQERQIGALAQMVGEKDKLLAERDKTIEALRASVKPKSEKPAEPATLPAAKNIKDARA